MFHQTRLKLTAWYLLIIMLVSVLFSVVIYKGLTFELDRMERLQRLRQEFPLNLRHFRDPLLRIDTEVLEETKSRIRWTLILINLGILIFSGAAGYFLAGRTLRPIQNMVDEQNRFITDASHELRTPLTALKTASEVGLRDPLLTLNDAKDLLKTNLEEIDDLQALTDHLLKLAQFDQVNGNLNLSQVSLSEVLREAGKKVGAFAKAKDIDLKIAPGNFSLKAEKDSLVDLLVILLDNAIKYSPQKTHVKVAVRESDSKLRIEVKDQGVGISSIDLPHIFDRFYRADKARSKTTAIGYGLGLSIAQKIVAQHQGKLEVQSQEEKGTTFIITLPKNLY